MRRVWNKIVTVIKWGVRYSGMEFIYRKFNPSNPQALPTGVIWLFGIYIAFFGVASQRYENRLDRIENRVNALLPLLVTKETRRTALGRISSVQRMACPRQPKIFEPLNNWVSLFGKEQTHVETVDFLKGVIEGFKKDLEKAYLWGAYLRGANLEATELTIEQLCNAKTLYQAKLEPKLESQVKERCPHLLEN